MYLEIFQKINLYSMVVQKSQILFIENIKSFFIWLLILSLTNLSDFFIFLITTYWKTELLRLILKLLC